MSDSDQVFCESSLSCEGKKNVGTEYVHTSQCTSAAYVRLAKTQFFFSFSQDMYDIHLSTWMDP